MAEKEIARIVADISARYSDVHIGVMHRLGPLGVGDVSIAIVCASPHRAESYEASRLLIYSAAAKKDRQERCDLEAGMAKLFATETAAEVSLEAMRILGGNGFSKDFPVERFYRDAPLLLIGGGTNELQHLIIAKGLLERYAV